MLERVDRMLLAVRDRARASETFVKMLGAQDLREESSQYLNAKCSVLALGESEVELWQADGPGPVSSQLENFGEGLMFAGYATRQFDALSARLMTSGIQLTQENSRIFIPASATYGFPMVISTWKQRSRVGQVSFFYEATNALNTDWRVVAQRYSDLFALDASRFAPINSDRFGYQGTLTLFDPVRGLDRIELSQTFADKPGAMRKFVERRGGDGFYMCFVEAYDFVGLRDRLLSAGATLTAQNGDLSSEKNSMWVHPKNLHGMLLGISRPSYAWSWSGQPERVVD